MSEFDKIIGYDRIKKELRQIVEIIKNKELRDKFNIRLPKGIILEGVPGVGKTMMAWAFIKESGFNLYHCKKDRPDGEFVKYITECFENAKKNAPAIVFLDDIDKFAEDASEMSPNSEEAVAIQTGFESVKNDDVVVIATANDCRILPESLRRCGRFDKSIYVGRPRVLESIDIIKGYLSNKKVSKDIDYEQIAHMMDGNTCADLETAVNEAAMNAALDGSDEITNEHLIDSISLLFMDMGSHEPPKDLGKRKRIAYHEAGHTLLAMLSKSSEPCYVSVSSYDNVSGVCNLYKESSGQSAYEDIIEKIKINLAGMATEEVVFNEKSMGSKSDLKHTYELLEDAIKDNATEGFMFAQEYSNYDRVNSEYMLQHVLERRNEILSKLYNEVKDAIKDNLDFIHKVAAELMEKRYLIHRDLLRLRNSK